MKKFLSQKVKSQKGFTLIEILVVIGIIAVLALIVLIAINPARQFALSRNTQRTSNVQAILNAIGQNMVDNKGVFTCSTASTGLTTGSTPISTSTLASTGTRICAGTPSGTTAGCPTGSYAKIDLSCLTPTYIPALPTDPSYPGAGWTSTTNYDTGYNVFVDTNGRVTVFAPTGEQSLGYPLVTITR